MHTSYVECIGKTGSEESNDVGSEKKKIWYHIIKYTHAQQASPPSTNF